MLLPTLRASRRLRSFSRWCAPFPSTTLGAHRLRSVRPIIVASSRVHLQARKCAYEGSEAKDVRAHLDLVPDAFSSWATIADGMLAEDALNSNKPKLGDIKVVSERLRSKTMEDVVAPEELEAVRTQYVHFPRKQSNLRDFH